jgi:amino acid transporter
MAELIYKLWILPKYFIHNLEYFLNPFLRKLDPSLFQNITLGVLAIFIPFTIVFLTDILNSKDEKRSQFEKMVLSDEVFGTKKIFKLSIIGIVFFAFFSGTDISSLMKIISIITALILVFLFWVSFKKVLKFSEGYKFEFEISFLKKLSLTKFFIFRDKSKADKMFQA